MDRKLAPAFHTPIDFKLPKPEKIGLGKSSIICLPYNQTPVAKIEFVFAAGKIAESNAGLAQFTVNLLDKGTHSKGAREIANILDYYGAHLELSADLDFAYVSLYCLNGHIKLLLPVIMSILTEPTFPDDELDKYRQIFIENLKVNQGKNSYLASIALRKEIFKNHPYGRSTEISDAQQITKQQIASFYQAKFKLINTFVTGLINQSELNLLSNFCEGFSKVTLNQEVADFGPSNLNTEIRYLEGPGKDQASIRFGKITLGRKSDQIATLTLLNHILGGFFGSRLMKNIREERGLTYGIYSSISHLKLASLFSIGAEVNTQNVEEARVEILKEIDRLEVISEGELQIAKNHLIGSMQNDNASIFSIADRLKTIELAQLNDSFYSNLSKKIATCTIQNLIEVAQIHLQTSSLTTVIIK